MKQAYIADAVRTPIGSLGGGLASVRTDDLAALVLKELVARNPQIPSDAIDDVILGCHNQAGEDNRNVARMALLLAGLPADQRELLELRLAGLTAVEIARVLGRSHDAVRKAESRAIRMLRDQANIGTGAKANFIRVGTLHNPECCPPDVHIYTESKQGWVIIPEGSEQFAGFYPGRDIPRIYGPEGAARMKALRG